MKRNYRNTKLQRAVRAAKAGGDWEAVKAAYGGCLKKNEKKVWLRVFVAQFEKIAETA